MHASKYFFLSDLFLSIPNVWWLSSTLIRVSMLRFVTVLCTVVCLIFLSQWYVSARECFSFVEMVGLQEFIKAET